MYMFTRKIIIWLGIFFMGISLTGCSPNQSKQEYEEYYKFHIVKGSEDTITEITSKVGLAISFVLSDNQDAVEQLIAELEEDTGQIISAEDITSENYTERLYPTVYSVAKKYLSPDDKQMLDDFADLLWVNATQNILDF